MVATLTSACHMASCGGEVLAILHHAVDETAEFLEITTQRSTASIVISPEYLITSSDPLKSRSCFFPLQQSEKAVFSVQQLEKM